ncbi:MAG: hypothetical protein JO247_15280, partial [Chloroflexi bacterium]|nr:hypothetical protein [Chloroflexota bacterium]
MIGRARDVELPHPSGDPAAGQRQLDAILAGIADGVTAQTTDGRLLYANRAMAGMVGVPSTQLLLDRPAARLFEGLELCDERGFPFDPSELPGPKAMAGEVPEDVLLRYRLPG